VKLIVGLGNPGNQYKNTRHNAGFIVVGNFAEKHGIDGQTNSKFNAIVGKGIVNSEQILIAQPLTFMNLSGESVSKIMNFYKIEIQDLLVVFDDISIDLGKMRFRKNGTDGGHNGIKSIISCIGSKEFARLKLGIGPAPPSFAQKDFVLGKFTAEETELFDKLVPSAVNSLEDWIENGTAFSQNKYNGFDAG